MSGLCWKKFCSFFISALMIDGIFESDGIILISRVIALQYSMVILIVVTTVDKDVGLPFS